MNSPKIRLLLLSFVLVLPASTLSTSLAHADAEDAHRQLTAWLQSMGLAPYLAVREVSESEVTLRGSAAFRSLLDKCSSRRCKLIDRVFLRAVNATGRPIDQMSLRIQGSDRCLRVAARWKSGKVQATVDRCRDAAGEAVVPEDLLAGLVQNSPSGSVELKRRAGITELRRQLTAVAAKRNGKITFTAESGNHIQFDLRGMRGQVLEGDSWWESISAIIDLVPSSDSSRGPILRWTASGSLAGGLGSEPPPIAAYEEDLEPKHRDLLQKFVGRFLNDVVNRDELSQRGS